ncbi:methyl-accepting chemotaxis sensory transducer with Cache sensor [Candidatus Vecturithrix granuli]|uniref:Methyl-accepting chemotaxis sensory transducer with Cache sensor n=1 Tax=Vecturithrix granuli TaxID=1499967 RepID=A0A081C7R8_VECG1|nr:methyl-accepting chemotaxis sensory transducer with Cache sensor [Candidatus Vecturithrix granuli]
MKSIKYTILVSFCTMAAISITALAVVISNKISESLSTQAEHLSAQMTHQIYETLNLPHQTFELLMREEIRRSVKELCENPVLIANAELGRLNTLKAELQSAARKHEWDFALLLNLKAQLLASFPSDLNDFEIEAYLHTWDVSELLHRMAAEPSREETAMWDTFTRQNLQALHVLKLDTRPFPAEGALSSVAASIITNDFDEPLGICLVGKLLNDYVEPLERLHRIAGYASIIYLDAIPIVHAGLIAPEDSARDFAPLPIPVEIQKRLLDSSKKQSHHVFTFAGVPYLSACSPLSSFTGKQLGFLCIGLPESQITDAQQTVLSSGIAAKQEVQAWIVNIGVVSLGFFAFASFLIAANIVKPLRQLTDRANKLARGDFQEDLRVTSRDEIGALSQSLNEVMHSFREIAATSEAIALGHVQQQVVPRSTEDVLGHSLQYMATYLSEMASLADTVARGDLTRTVHLRSHDDSLGQSLQAMTTGLRSLIEQIRTSVEQLTSTEDDISSLATLNIEIVKNVHTAIAQMTATMTEMQNSVAAVSENMDTLNASVEETSLSASQMEASMDHIASHTQNFTRQAQHTMDFVTQVVSALEQILKSTASSQQLSQETMQEAREGQQAVKQVMSSVQTIQQTISMAVEAITQFAHSSEEIDTILEVIRDITDQTSLLSLNASIIAAQAGEQGRGFAVVAGEIKHLSTGVAASTKDIARILQNLQQNTSRIVQAVHEGAADVKCGLEHTIQAQTTLEHITTSAERSSAIVAEIAEALHSLMLMTHQVFAAMTEVNTMTADMMTTINEHQIGTRQIHQAIAQITDLSFQVQQASADQLAGVRHVLDSAQDVVMLMDHNLESSQHVVQVVKDLSTQADLLLDAVDRFKLRSEPQRAHPVLAPQYSRGGRTFMDLKVNMNVPASPV